MPPNHKTFLSSRSAVAAALFSALLLGPFAFVHAAPGAGVRVGAAAVDLEADDNMVIGGSILGGAAKGQEGKLRAVAVVLEKPGGHKLAIVACDILMFTRDFLDQAAAEIEKTTGIPAAHVLINCTHTHHAPSTVRVHGYDRDERFCREVQRKIIQAVRQADANLSAEECRLDYHLGREDTVGMNSRLLLSDGAILWSGDRSDAVRPTGPFDPELPVLAFRNDAGKLRALLFNHSTHTMGVLQPGRRSPAFYGLAAQQLEAELGGVVSFLQGASGSTHNLLLKPAEAKERIHSAVVAALGQAQARPVDSLAAIKRPFSFKIRSFDEAAEDRVVTDYCRKRLASRADSFIEVFRRMRGELAPLQGQTRTTWLQVLRIGDVALIGVPAEFFTKLGLDIKNRSPFRHTFIAELANDWIGYVPDADAFKLGGYQVWTGLHSYVEPGTGERMVDEVLAMLRELQNP